MRYILGFLTLSLAVVAVFSREAIFNAGIDANLSWTLSSLLTWVIVLLLSIFAVFALRFILKGKWAKILFTFLLPLALLGLMFAVNPIYVGDYVKKGEALNIENHVLLDIVEDYKSDFDGIVAVVDYNCPFCRIATKERLTKINLRKTDIDMVLTLNTSDLEKIEGYAASTKSKSLHYLQHKPEADIVELIKGAFPSFVYIKNGKILHKWRNSELGFPALDWIEGGL
jgi:hypothetical protein